MSDTAGARIDNGEECVLFFSLSLSLPRLTLCTHACDTTTTTTTTASPISFAWTRDRKGARLRASWSQQIQFVCLTEPYILNNFSRTRVSKRAPRHPPRPVERAADATSFPTQRNKRARRDASTSTFTDQRATYQRRLRPSQRSPDTFTPALNLGKSTG